jgi:drug/metabolite transporter (DMT)-like permease
MFALLAMGPQVIGHSSLNWALRYLSPTFVTVSVLGEPIGSTILAYWVLQEKPKALELIGGAVILAGIYVCSRVEAAAGTPLPNRWQDFASRFGGGGLL